MNHDSSHPENKPWYRQFWPWFIILLPASSVVAGLTTLAIAIQNADDVVVDQWYKEGKVINKSLAAEKQAAELQLRAVLGNENGAAVLRFAPHNQPDAPSMRLELRHPTIADRDQLLRLVRSGSGEYRAPVSLPQGSWVVTLEPEPGDWRIRRRVSFQSGATTTLEPTLW